jgi:D-alanyl-D-alanine carboxypeptidase
LLAGFILAFGFFCTASATLIDADDGTAGASPSDSIFLPDGWRADYLKAVQRVMEEFHIPGVVAGVWGPEERAWKIARGVGDVRSGRPIALDDHFPIRSVTKSFTVTLILQLVRQGIISLDDPIEQYVPGIPSGNEITLAHLAAMESGGEEL